MTPVFAPTESALLSHVFSGKGSPEAPASLFIDGQWVPAESGATRTITNPADRSVVGVVSEASDVDTEKAIRAARIAFDAGDWSATPASERGKILVKVAEKIRAHKDEFAPSQPIPGSDS